MNQPLKSPTVIRDEYLNHIAAQKTSGLSTAAYCKLHNLNLNKLYHYKSYRPEEAKVKTVNNFAQVKIQANRNNLNLPLTKTELPSLVQNYKIIDPVWLAKFIFTLSNC